VEEVGGWNTQLRYGNDFDLLVRILSKHQAVYVQSALSSRRRHAQSLTVSDFRAAVWETHRRRRKLGGRLASRATYEEILAVAKPILKRVLRVKDVNVG
jgi:hypothetical protein